MREQTSLIKAFDGDGEELALEATKVQDAFHIPDRNWNALIDAYNQSNKKPFLFTALQCKLIIEHVKRSAPPRYVFKTLGISYPKFQQLFILADELEEQFQELASRPSLEEEQLDEFHRLLRHPLRVLAGDIGRAEGVADLMDWEKLNEFGQIHPEVHMTKMKAKFKDIFGDKAEDQRGQNIIITLGGTWAQEL